MKYGAIALFLICLPLTTRPPEVRAQASGARVFEDLAVTRWYVSPTGSDSNTGSREAEPFRTIGKAVATASKRWGDAGAKILIAPGTYRETIVLPPLARKTDGPLVLEAQKKGTAIVSGADAWNDGWTQEENVYRHAWPHEWGVGGVAHPGWSGLSVDPITRRREMIFVNDRRLEQVLERDQIAPGRFFVDENARTVHVQPLPGTDWPKAQIEVAVRDRLFHAQDARNVVLRGLGFRHANTHNAGAVVFTGCEEIVVEDCDLSANNAAGLDLQRCANVTLSRNVVSENGSKGIGGAFVRNVVCENNETSYNNWRGAMGGLLEADNGGLKLAHASGILVRKHRAFHNRAAGVWFGPDSKNITLVDSTLVDNQVCGLFLEASPGLFLIQRCAILNNAHGVYFSSAQKARLEHCVIANNGGSQIIVFGNYGAGRSGEDWETGAPWTVHPRATTLTGCVIAAELGAAWVNPSGNPSRLFGWNRSDTQAWNRWMSTLKADNNTYYHPETTSAFFKQDGEPVGLAAWRKAGGQDAHSMWKPYAPTGTFSLALSGPSSAAKPAQTDPIELSATVGEPGPPGAVRRVEFFANRQKIGEATAPPYRVTWHNAPKGNQVVRAWATTADGAQTPSPPFKIMVTAGPRAQGLLREYWRGVPEGSLPSLSSKTDRPTGVEYLERFETPERFGVGYAQRLRGYVVPPTTGVYTFWIASDDDSELWLSSSEAVGEKKRVAYVTGFTQPREWQRFSTQHSEPIQLEAGKRYYVEALHNQNQGTDNLSVAWQTPGREEPEVISGAALAPYRGN